VKRSVDGSGNTDTFAVIGSDGMIGRALKRALDQQGERVYGTSRRGEDLTQHVVALDLIDESSWGALPSVDVAFFCAAVTSFAECRADPDRARAINVEGPSRLAESLVSRGSRVVLLSTSAVFDWTRPTVPEDCAPCPTSLYGTLKAEAELRFLQLGDRASIVRFGKVLHPELSLFKNWLKALSAGESVVAFSDLYMAPVSVEQAVQALISVGLAGAGIFQLSGASDISYFEAARHLALRLGRDAALVKEGKAVDFGVPKAEITRYSSLESRRIEELTGRLAPDPFSAIEETFFSPRMPQS